MKRRGAYLLSLLLLFTAGLFYTSTRVQATTPAHYRRPTLLIAGLGAGKQTYNNFITHAEQRDDGRYALTAVIEPDHIQYFGHWQPDYHHPLIKVVFANKWASWQQNAIWLNRLLTQLKQRYHIRSFNAIAHSRGNLDLLIAYSHQHPLLLKRAVLISVPADGALGRGDTLQNRLLANGRPEFRHDAYRDLVHARKDFPPGVHVLSIMGNVGNGTDSRVTNVSSKSLVPALGQRFSSYRQVLVRGPLASHHLIVRRNPRVRRLALNFLWPEQKDKRPPR
ncbi:alpha/beta hydrolase [Loigolactobacillus binensis]|uniref:Alpha/beta hydrolase n=1 Tax=Loigolactobacillus binensis TaxID=2559922 RepID=A0ABW3E7U2_9LACO|nr:alpha/beta hydrolase [Loigolactobacillus binensis]